LFNLSLSIDSKCTTDTLSRITSLSCRDVLFYKCIFYGTHLTVKSMFLVISADLYILRAMTVQR
jgi:hypothetical protein